MAELLSVLVLHELLSQFLLPDPQTPPSFPQAFSYDKYILYKA